MEDITAFEKYKRIISLSLFKGRLLCPLYPVIALPSQFTYDSRLLFIIHEQVRNNLCDLEEDLFSDHLSARGPCLPCRVEEDEDYYFFYCKRYKDERIQSSNKTHHLHPLNFKLLLSGNNYYNT